MKALTHITVHGASALWKTRFTQQLSNVQCVSFFWRYFYSNFWRIKIEESWGKMSSFQFTQNGPFWFWRIWKRNSKRDWNHIVHNVYDTQTCHIFATNAWIFVKNSDFPDFQKSTFLAVFWGFWHFMTHLTMINDLPVKKGTRQKNIVKNSTPYCQKCENFSEKNMI